MRMFLLMESAMPQYVADRLDFLITGAIICLGAGILVLIASVVLLKIKSSRKR